MKIILITLLLFVSTVAHAALEINISWVDNSSNEDGFTLERKVGGGGYSTFATLGVNAQTAKDTTVTLLSSYCYRVKAFNTAGSSDYSNEACMTMDVPSAPTNLAIAIGVTPPIPSVLAYNFITGSGNAVFDISGNGRDATSNGTTWVTGKYDSAMSFTGTGKATTPLLSHAAQRTYACWCKFSTPLQLGRIFDKRTSSAEAELLYVDIGVLRYARVWSGSPGSWFIPLPTLGVFHHIAVSYDTASVSNSPKFYVDGILQTSSVLATPSGTISANTDPYILGNRGNGDRPLGTGNVIDEFVIYDTILTQAQITALKDGGPLAIALGAVN